METRTQTQRNRAVTTGEGTTFLATLEILLTSRRTGERRITTVTMRVITTDRNYMEWPPNFMINRKKIVIWNK